MLLFSHCSHFYYLQFLKISHDILTISYPEFLTHSVFNNPQESAKLLVFYIPAKCFLFSFFFFSKMFSYWGNEYYIRGMWLASKDRNGIDPNLWPMRALIFRTSSKRTEEQMIFLLIIGLFKYWLPLISLSPVKCSKYVSIKLILHWLKKFTV